MRTKIRNAIIRTLVLVATPAERRKLEEAIR